MKGEASPCPQRRKKKQPAESNSRYHMAKLATPQTAVDNTTVFFLPGLDVKVRAV